MQTKIRTEHDNALYVFFREYGSVFHQYSYLKNTGQKYKCIVVCENGNEIIGALPLVKSNKNKLKAYHTPPYTHLFGPVIHSDYKGKYFDILNAILKSLPPSGHYDFKMYLEQEDITPWLANGFTISSSQTHIVPMGVDYSLSTLSKDKRRDVKKLLKALDSEQISLFENDNNSNDIIRELWLKTASRSGFSSHENVLRKILHSEVQNYTNLVVDCYGSPLAGSFCPYDNHNMYHVIGANIRVEDPLLRRANFLSLYKAISFANSNGLNFDTEGSNIAGVSDYYRRMGAQPKLIYRAQKSPSLYYQLLRAGKTWLNERK